MNWIMSVQSLFDEQQVYQFLLADTYGQSDTECKKHPEWSSDFMNFYINRERNGEDNHTMHLIADYLQKHCFLSDQTAGQIGSNFDLLAAMITYVDNGNCLPFEPPLHQDYVDETMLLFMLTKANLLAKGHDCLLSGRLCINRIPLFDDIVIMGEGILLAEQIFRQLQFVHIQSVYNARTRERCNNDSSVIAGSLFMMQNILFVFDDMHIRGQQIIDALEYCDKSVQTLYECVMRRYSCADERFDNLIRYVNQKAAMRIASSNDKTVREYVAVRDGASFDYREQAFFVGWRNQAEAMHCYHMNIYDYKNYLCNVKPLIVDWFALDIMRGVDMSSAIRIAKARGFKMVRFFRKAVSCCDHGIRYYLLMYQPDTSSYLFAVGATKDDVCHGGALLRCYVESVPSLVLQATTRIICNAGVCCYEFTHNDCLFASYDELLSYNKHCVVNWSDVRFHAYGIPIIEYFDPVFLLTDTFVSSTDSYLTSIFNDDSLRRMHRLINHILMHYDYDINTVICPQYVCTYDDVHYEDVIHSINIDTQGDLCHAVYYIRIAFLYLLIPYEEQLKYINALHDYAVCCDADEKEISGGPMRWICVYQNVVSVISDGFKGEDVVLAAMNLPDIFDLPVRLPWIAYDTKSEV